MTRGGEPKRLGEIMVERAKYWCELAEMRDVQRKEAEAMKSELPELVAGILRDWLLSEFEDISEDHYCAGWMSGIEHSIWNAIELDPIPAAGVDYGMHAIPKATLEKIKQVRDLIGEWPSGYGVGFVSVEGFRKRHDALAGDYVTLYAVDLNNGKSGVVQ